MLTFVGDTSRGRNCPHWVGRRKKLTTCQRGLASSSFLTHRRARRGERERDWGGRRRRGRGSVSVFQKHDTAPKSDLLVRRIIFLFYFCVLNVHFQKKKNSFFKNSTKSYKKKRKKCLKINENAWPLPIICFQLSTLKKNPHPWKNKKNFLSGDSLEQRSEIPIIKLEGGARV